MALMLYDRLNDSVGDIILDTKDFGDKLWATAGRLLSILTKAGYQCVVEGFEPGTSRESVFIQYSQASDPELGAPVVAWLDPAYKDDVLELVKSLIESDRKEIQSFSEKFKEG